MTDFRLFQIERVYRLQFWIWWKRQKVFQKVRKHCGKRRNCLLRAISPFPTVFADVKSRACLGKGEKQVFLYVVCQTLNALNFKRSKIFIYGKELNILFNFSTEPVRTLRMTTVLDVTDVAAQTKISPTPQRYWSNFFVNLKPPPPFSF